MWKGNCENCGHCCKNDTKLIPNGPDNKHHAEVRGYTIVQETEDNMQVDMPCVCPAYDGKGCKLHGTNKKPKHCVSFPNMTMFFRLDPNKVLPQSCGYYWEDHE